MRNTFLSAVILGFLSNVWCGDLPLIRLNTTFALSSCQAFSGTQKQATVRAFCQTINDRASFPATTTCDVDNSYCTEPARRALLQIFFAARIVQLGTFNGMTSQQVNQDATNAVSNTTAFQEDLVQTLNDAGDGEIANEIANTDFEGATTETEDDPEPAPNQCESDVDCDLLYSATPFCLNTTSPYVCVQCIENEDCDVGESCSGYNECQPNA